MASVVLDAARRRGMASLPVRGQAPHAREGATHPAVRRVLLTLVPGRLSLERAMSPCETAVQAGGPRGDQALAQDAAPQASGRQGAQDDATTGDEAPHPQRDEACTPEPLR